MTGLNLAPGDISGYEVCPWRTSCLSTCIHFSGVSYFQKTKDIGRIRRTRLFFQQRALFRDLLLGDIDKAARLAKSLRRRLAIRLNTTSDIAWESVFPEVFRFFPNVQFFDYTKSADRALRSVSLNWLINYHITYSRSENTNQDTIRDMINQGINVAVVFMGYGRKRPLPSTWLDYPVCDGDTTDLRFLDPKSHIVGLRAKGSLRNNNLSQFAVSV